MEYRVNIYIETSRHGPSKGPGRYAYILYCIKPNGEPHIRQGYGELENTTENQLALMAIAEAGNRVTKPSVIRVFTRCEHVLNSMHRALPAQWEKNDWNKANGKPVKNMELWQEVVKAMVKHAVTYTKDGHPFEEKLQKILEEEHKNV